jgi:hypothetical protein
MSNSGHMRVSHAGRDRRRYGQVSSARHPDIDSSPLRSVLDIDVPAFVS